MTLEQIAKKLGWTRLTAAFNQEVAINDAYACAKLSTTLGNAKHGSVILAEETHKNMLVIGVDAKAAAIVLCGDRIFDETTINMANKADLPVFSTPDHLFEASGRLYQLLNPKP